MRINVFEGARRISLLIGALWAIGWGAHAIFSEPNAQVIYSVLSFGVGAVVENCPDSAATEYVERETPEGKSVKVTLCFLAANYDGEMLVPYGDAGNGKVWVGQNFSTEVREYTAEVARNFQLTPEGIKVFEANHRKAFLEQLSEAAQGLFGGLAVGWAVVEAIGWIVRGFMGIPRGQDTRPGI